MAREVVQYVWCDLCLVDDVREAGTEVTISVDNLKPRKIALCETHQKEVIEPLRELLLGVGQVVDDRESAPSTESHKCELEGCPHVAPSSAGLRQHIRQRHGMLMGEYRGRISAQRAADPSLPDEFKCPVEGCDFVIDPTGYKQPLQSIRMHVRRMHEGFDPNTKGAKS